MRLACVFMAAGHSKRFGQDKLSFTIDGTPMAKRCFMSIPDGVFKRVIVVTRSEYVAALAREFGFDSVSAPVGADNTALTIRLGLEACGGDMDGCMFAVCDQPYLKKETVKALTDSFAAAPDRIAALSWNGGRGNPVIFPAALFGELMTLPENASGRHVIARHMDILSLVETESRDELRDIDSPADLSR